MDTLLIIILIRAILGGIAAAIASSKNRSGVGWFFGGFFLGIIGIVIVAVLGDPLKDKQEKENISMENRRLKEQLMQEKMKNEAFREHTYKRLDIHDRKLGVDTRSANNLLEAKKRRDLDKS